MIIWLDRNNRYEPRVGIDRDVLRADEFASVIEVDRALAEACRLATQTIEAAQAQAQAIRDAAEAAARASDLAAGDRFDASGRLGYAAGMRRALDEAHATMQYRVHEEQMAVRRGRARLAGIVMKAVEQVVLKTDRDALFARIGVTLQRLIDSESYLTLIVHPADATRARRMLAEASASAGWHGGFEVQVDAATEVGSCVCEWDYGVLVTGLDAQLAAIKRSLLASVDSMIEPAP